MIAFMGIAVWLVVSSKRNAKCKKTTLNQIKSIGKICLVPKPAIKLSQSRALFFKTHYRVLCNSNGESHVSLIKMSNIIVRTYLGENDHH